MNDAIDADAPADFADFTYIDWSTYGGAEAFPGGAAPMMHGEPDFAIILSGSGVIEVVMAPGALSADDDNPDGLAPYFQFDAPRNRPICLAMGRAIRDELRRIADPINQILALREMGFREA